MIWRHGIHGTAPLLFLKLRLNCEPERTITVR
jgi:hypothetical protein